ncbi:C-Jun-amino-terminal kinase-interacting protein 4-like isoform X3 [Chelonoidis abingdonii]|uniref:C-Jun-amino-terminal kinase-interacting protein 4-like isoform X3 n=1 Tax=Chelonoidis abingdonii TaxID=106734 RepID=UPI003F495D05
MEEVFGEEGESAAPALGEEMVLGLAAGLYGELEQLVGAYGRGAVAGLLPQLLSVLEALEQARGQIQERDEALELLRDDRLGLLGQYERERSGRKRAEERYMELEDVVEQERKGHKAALSRLDGQSRRLEEKARSYADQLASLEEQKAALLKELSALGQTHSKMVQRYKELKALTVPPPAPSTPRPSGVASAPHWPPLFLPSTSDPGCSEPPKGSAEALGPALAEGTPEPQQDEEGPTRNSHPLAQELPLPAGDGSPQRCQELAEILSSTPELDPTPDLPASPPTPQRNMESLFAEVSGLSLELLGDVDEGADLQGDAVQTLMMENAELRDTRLVLDTARRHLIARVEELMGERESLREERDGATEALSRCQGHLRETEQDLSRIQQELEEIKKQNSDDAEVEAQASQRKRFTRAEMARVLTERNLYKERLMELQEAVRRTEMLRASREVQAAQMKKSSFWKFFDRLFSASDSPERVPASSPVSEHRGNGGRAPPAVRYLPRPASPTDTREPPNLSPQQQKRDLYRQIRSHIWKQHGRAPVHGWSPPAIPQVRAEQAEGQDLPMLAQLRLLDQKDPSTKRWLHFSTGQVVPVQPAPASHPRGAVSQSLGGPAGGWARCLIPPLSLPPSCGVLSGWGCLGRTAAARLVSEARPLPSLPRPFPCPPCGRDPMSPWLGRWHVGHLPPPWQPCLVNLPAPLLWDGPPQSRGDSLNPHHSLRVEQGRGAYFGGHPPTLFLNLGSPQTFGETLPLELMSYFGALSGVDQALGSPCQSVLNPTPWREGTVGVSPSQWVPGFWVPQPASWGVSVCVSPAGGALACPPQPAVGLLWDTLGQRGHGDGCCPRQPCPGAVCAAQHPCAVCRLAARSPATQCREHKAGTRDPGRPLGP